MPRHTATIARFTVLEGLRARFLRITVLLLILLCGFALFVGDITLTESQRIQATLLGAMVRPGCVFLLSLYIIGSLAREFNDKGTDLILALDVSRASYVIGKLLGFAVLGILLAVAAGLLVALFSAWRPALIWATSLLFELWIVAALSLFCAITLVQVLPAASLVLGFYLLSRGIATLQLLGGSPLLEATGYAHAFTTHAIDAIALLLPRLDLFTQSAWLAGYPASAAMLLPLLGQSLLYGALLIGAALFDFYRKNF